MVPARNLLRRHPHNNYGAFGDLFQEKEKSLLISSPMADQEEQVESSKRKEADDSWLQLGIGSSSAAAADTNNKPSTGASRPTTAAVPIFPAYGFGYNSNSVMNMGMGGYNSNYPQFVGQSASNLTVISRPSRRQTGVWFILQASKNQRREPFLQQIPKSYLRIKDCRMTVRLLMKYLVKKLGLDDESEVEISCRGQLLHPYLTLEEVRNNIWCLPEAVDLPAEHVMTMQYGTSR